VTPSPADVEVKTVQLNWARLALILVVTVGAWFVLDLAVDWHASSGAGSSLFGLGFLFVVPFGIGVVLGVISQRLWPDTTSGLRVGLWIAGVFFVLSFVSGPGVLCVIMAAPFWLTGLVLGALSSNWIVQRKLPEQVATVAIIVAFAGGVMAFDGRDQFPVSRFTVERTIIVAASPERIWPQLLRLDGIEPEDGEWTISHAVLGVPRPTEAVVRGVGVGAVRTGRWGNKVWFEEHIVGWTQNSSLDWRFVFPAGSTLTSVDQHIDPRGPNVVVERGGYALEPLPSRATRVRLHTTYSVRTGVNAYASMWAQRILGDVQTNILAIVKDRSENTGATDVIVAADQTANMRSAK
jgi:hypothetical protein